MLGAILAELAQVERWLDDLTKGHETHDPEQCQWAELIASIRDLGGYDESDDAAIVTFALICLLAKTRDAAKAGVLIVDKVRELTATMARDRIQQARERAASMGGNVAVLPTRSYDTPN